MKKCFAVMVFIMVFFSSFAMVRQSFGLSFTLKATPECGYIFLEWEPVAGADRYYIYRGPGEGQEYETPLTDFPIEETTYKDVTDLVINQKYCYYVKAVNQEGREFLQSIEACAIFTCQEEIPDIGDKDCKLVLKYQVGNFYYWRNENQKGPMDVEPVLLNNRVLASARYLAEEVGATVGWDASTRTVSIVTLDGNEIQMQIGNPIMLVNGQQIQIDPNNKAVTPIIYKNRTMLPFRALAYNLGATGPDDIVWLGDIKTAVLTFNDGNCNWICGCYKSYVSPTAATSTYQFYKGCDENSKMSVTIPPAMKDKLHGWIFAEYIKQYPNMAKWCVEVRLDKDGSVIAWRARPDQYPNCCKPKECKWVCGCVIKWTEAPNNHVSIYFSVNCKQDSTDSINFIVPMTMKDTALGITLIEYFRKYGNQNYWCMEICVDANRRLVQWKATPEKYPDCCKPVVECKEVCGCILGMEIITDTKVLIKFSPDCDQANITNLLMDGSLLDTHYQLSVTDYIKKFPDQKYWCVIMCIGSNGEVVKWTATPEKYPNCCKPVLDCKEVCGCILAVDSVAGTNKTEILFSPDCDPTNVLNLVMLGNIPDTQFGISFTEYLQKYPNQKYWCATLCLIEDTEIVKWTATPEKYPDCCKQEGGRIVAYFPEKCIAGTGVFIYDATGQVVWKGEPNGNGIIDTGCTLKCPDVYTVVPVNQNCTFTPVKQEVKVLCCPEKTEIKFDCDCEPLQKLCCCVVRMTIDPDANGNYSVYLKKDCNTGDPVYDLVLLFSATLLDTNLGMTILQYYQSIPPTNPPKMGCLEVSFNSSNQVISWAAYPDRSPCCGESKGRIITYVPEKCIKGTVMVVYDANGDVVWKGEATSNNQFDTGCTLKCPAKYTIVMKNETCKFTPEKLELDVPCCPKTASYQFSCDCESNYGRIKIKVPKDCAPNTYFTIYDAATGEIVLKLTSADYVNGLFDTGCKIPCNKAYKIVPLNDKCKLTPESVTVKVPCCPQFAEASFDIVQTEANGRIVGYLPGTCVKGTKILVADMEGNIVWSGTPNENGYFDTECTIKCGVSYQVIPKNSAFAFTPEYKDVKLPCCPEKVEVKFDCAQKKGRVLVNIPRDCIQGSTLVWVYDVEPSADVKPLGAIMMDYNNQFDSECTLECNKTYWLMPQNEKCKFYPTFQKVTLPCCPEYAKVDFKCECETEKARIIISLPKVCIEGTKVLIYDDSNTLVATLTANSQGVFDTGCTLQCNTYYSIVPKNEKCKFSPEREMVKTNCCPETTSVTFQCDCQEKTARIVCNMPADCAASTKVLIYDAAGNLATTLTVNASGVFDSGCTLKCDSSYTVVPKSEKCKFYPESQVVRTTCCPESTSVSFKCECESAKARIVITIPTNCVPNTTVYVYEGEHSENKRPVLSLTPDRSGKCDTGCVLKCNTLYTIVPKNSQCTFYPASSPVKTTCCPEVSTVAFKCECEGPGSLPPEEELFKPFIQPRCLYCKEEILI